MWIRSKSAGAWERVKKVAALVKQDSLVTLLVIVTSWIVTLLGVTADSIAVLGCVELSGQIPVDTLVLQRSWIVWFSVFYGWFLVCWFGVRWSYTRFRETSADIQWSSWSQYDAVCRRVINRQTFNLVTSTGILLFPLIILLTGPITEREVLGTIMMMIVLVPPVGFVVYMAVSRLSGFAYSDFG